MKQVQLNKIASNYEIINNNKVQKNESLKRRFCEEDKFPRRVRQGKDMLCHRRLIRHIAKDKAARRHAS